MPHSQPKKVFVIDGLRSPFAKAGKELAHIHPSVLASQNIKEFLYKMEFCGDEIEEVILGNAFTLPETSNIARVAALRAGLPKEISAVTVLRNCASSMESFVAGLAKIKAGLYSSVLAGGVESMSFVPFLLSHSLSEKAKLFFLTKSLKGKLKIISRLRISDFKLISPILTGLTDPLSGLSMGETAELLAGEFNIRRDEQDDFALSSHQKALAGERKLKEELFPFPLESQVLDKDKGPNPRLNKERLAKFPPYFDKKRGTVSIANSCPMNDGSSLLLLMSEKRATSLGLRPLASVLSAAFAGLEPQRMGLGPVYASALALKKAGLSLKDIDLIEINEAFSAQVLACLKAFASKKFCGEKLGLSSALGEIDPQKLNVNGGAIAIGHPISATGSRLILTLAKEMKRRKAKFGLASLCIGGGQGGAVILENIP